MKKYTMYTLKMLQKNTAQTKQQNIVICDWKHKIKRWILDPVQINFTFLLW